MEFAADRQLNEMPQGQSRPDKPSPDNSTAVEDFLERLEHPLKPAVLALRRVVLGADARLTEQVKWNAPSFCLDGDDRLTMKLHPPKNVQLIFHRGAKKQTPPTRKLIADELGLLKWAANDRAVATFASLAEVEARAADLAALIKRWLEAAG